MGQDVYADLYFLINSGMDLLCLMLSATILHRRLSVWRALLASALGGIYAVVSLLLVWDGFGGFLADCVMAILICAVALWQRTQREQGLGLSSLLKLSGVFVLVSMILGGIMTALYSILNKLELPLSLLEGDGLSVWTFVIVSAVGGLITARGGRLFGRSQRSRSLTVEATLLGTPVTLRALVDTGNLLRDPVSGRAVIVADVEALSHALPPALAEACRKGEAIAYLSVCKDPRPLRPIATRTASGERLLLAIVPDHLSVRDGREAYRADHLIAPVPLGEAAQGFDAVIGSD